MDADADSTLSAVVDDILKIQLQSVACFYFNGTVASPVNGVTFTASATGVAPSLTAQGSDTNIDLSLRGKGTGGIDLGTVSTATTFGSTVVNKVGADVASAAALPVNVAGNLFDVTGTTSITSIATKGVGTEITLQFDGELTLTHHATDLILPNGLNIKTYAGYIVRLYEYATGDWRYVADNRSSYAVNSTTGTGATSFEVTDVPPWARRVIFTANSLSLNLSDNIIYELGDASSYVSSGYSAQVTEVASGAVSAATNSAAFDVSFNATANTFRGLVEMTLMNASTNLWFVNAMFQSTTGDPVCFTCGSVALTGPLTRFRFKSLNGVRTFDAATYSRRYEI